MDKNDYAGLEPIDPKWAYSWDCPKCSGITIYGDYAKSTFPDEESEREAKQGLGIEPYQEADLVHVPYVLSCPICETVYRNAEVDLDWVRDEAPEDWSPQADLD